MSFNIHQLRVFHIIIAVTLSISISSCGFSELTDNLYPPQEIEFAKNYLKRIKEKDFEYTKSILDPSIEKDVSDEKLELLSSLFYEGEPISTEIIGSRVHIVNDVWFGNFTFEYKFQDGWIVANTALKKVPDGYSVVGFSVYRTPNAQRELNAFTLADKSALHYLVLVSTAIIFLFMLFSFIMCLRTDIVRRKWLWAILTLVGLGSLQFNWTTGAYEIQVLTIQLIGMGITASGQAAPWIFTTTFPIGSLLFWIKRKKLIAEYQEKKTQHDNTDTKNNSVESEPI